MSGGIDSRFESREGKKEVDYTVIVELLIMLNGYNHFNFNIINYMNFVGPCNL